ncbi:GNAT family N-acetyltransferase [Mycoplasma sp. P36-A1]|uniref:GNAT family N-acetyltransferase n=1 Tax=Mycoplasma sp. P36-A1 TaxID=3252900 RepID=UPI003C2B3D02
MNIKESRDANLLAKLNEPIHKLHYDIAPDLFKPYDVNSIEKWFKEELKKDNTYCFIAYDDNEFPVGFLLAYELEEKEDVFQYKRSKMQIEQISILGAFQSKGYGSALIARIEQLASEKGIREVEINYWSTNIRGKFFYKCNGYEIYRETVKKRVI